MLKKWSTLEDSFLRENYPNMSKMDLSESLGRTSSSISHRLFRINLSKNKKWTDEDELFIKENYLKLSNAELSVSLNCSESKIENRLFKIKLKRPSEWQRVRKIKLLTFSPRSTYPE